jgi:hypothetical protein
MPTDHAGEKVKRPLIPLLDVIIQQLLFYWSIQLGVVSGNIARSAPLVSSMDKHYGMQGAVFDLQINTTLMPTRAMIALYHYFFT